MVASCIGFGIGGATEPRRVLWHRAHAKDEARISQGEIVENKRLGAALGWITERQRDRDAQHLANPKISLRSKARIRAAAGLTA